MKRSPLQRKTPLKRSSKEMKRTPLKQSSKPMNRGDGLQRKKKPAAARKRSEKEDLLKLEREEKLGSTPECEFCGETATETHRRLFNGEMVLNAVCAECFRKHFGVAGSRSAEQQEYYQEQRQIAFERSGGVCEAEGLHHPDCPGVANITHHVRPRPEGPDHADNLITLWNGHTSLGAGGCHQLVHSERGSSTRPGKAVDLGLITSRE